ncbi:MAG: CoA transferase [Dehalococcoidales bacterium]|nr:CoA transferase [Dehalococcoidales bacterium]
MSILNNIRILDFTWALAGPYATRLLADFGAEVIKVQSPVMAMENNAFARGYYKTWNRNKLGITLNLNRLEGVALARRLAQICDVVVENFSPRVLANWRMDYDNLKKSKSEIILVSLSVMGKQSSYNGFGATVQALSGMTHFTSFPGGPPLGPGFSYADHVAGLYASIKLMEALEQRRKTGKGQHIDLSEVDIMIQMLPFDEFTPLGNNSPLSAPQNIYLCRDGRWCVLSITNEAQWRGLKKALGNPIWAENVKFSTLSGRLNNREELNIMVTGWTQQYTATEVMSRLQRSGVPGGIIKDARDLTKNPQLKARGFFIKSSIAPLVDAVPFRMSAARAEYKKPAPSPGADNEYVYGKLLGLTKPEMSKLKANQVI